LATLPDSLSLWDNVYPERGVEFVGKNPHNFQQVIKQDGIHESRFFSIKVEIFSDLVDKIQKEVWQDKDYQEILKQLAKGESVPDYFLEPQAKLLLFKDRVVIPRNEEIQLNILQKRHDSPLAGHPGQEKTLKLIKSDFYWDGMNEFIKEYVSSCQECSRNKNIHHKKFGLLKPFQIPSGPWNSLSIDFITQLPLSNSFDSILVVVDIFSKMEIFIPAYGRITALELAQIFISHVFSKNGIPKLKISRDLSTTFHPKTDGQTERVNQIIEQYLWMYQVVKEELESEIRRFNKYADRNGTIAPDFQRGDKVWLASKNIKTTRPTKRLAERWMGPSEVIKNIGGHAYHLKLPLQWKAVHPAFHVSLLEPVKQSSIPNHNQLPPPPVLVEEQEKWEVNQVLDSNLKRGKLWYLVEWGGLSEDPEKETWEPFSNLTSLPDLVKDFYSLNPDKSGPNTSRV
ncbi:hypothetical protein O181_081603, partial [Austropuccinia psidii MF-1]|nr:hypothetical protein [Austropuccinia psidii MF-1]